MKKVLFATTALVASTGFAAAEVAISGYAEMGIFGGDKYDVIATPGDEGRAQFHSDLDVTFTLSGTTDNGLTFGASIDLDEVGDDANAAGGDPISNNGRGSGVEEQAVFISGGFGTLTMGDTDGALDWAVTEFFGNPGSIADDETSHAGGNDTLQMDGIYDGQVLRWDYSAGGFGVAVSAELDDSDVQSDGYGLGLKYNLDLGGTTVNLGLAWQTATAGPLGKTIAGTTAATGTDVDAIGLSAGASFGGGFTAGVTYVMYDLGVAGDVDYTAISGAYTTGPITIHVNYGMYDTPLATTDQDGVGLAVAYDLGGGAAVHLGYGSGSVGTASSLSSYSLGVAMSF